MNLKKSKLTETIVAVMIMCLVLFAVAQAGINKLMGVNIVNGFGLHLIANGDADTMRVNTTALVDSFLATWDVDQTLYGIITFNQAIVLPDGSIPDADLSANVSLLGQTISASEMADGDHGAFTYTSGVAALDADVVTATEILLSISPSWTGAHDFGGATSIEIPNGTSPTVNAAGEIAIDTDADGNYIDQGWFTFHDGTQQMYCPAFDAIGTPSDNDIIAYDAGTDKWVIEAQSAGGGTPGGSDTQIQYNDNGSFGGITGFIWDDTNIEVADDVNLAFGTDTDWKIEYDEGVDDQFLFVTTNTAAINVTDPMFEILVGTTPTADQQVFGIAKGTQISNTPLLTVDEDGDIDYAGQLNLNAGTVDALNEVTANLLDSTVLKDGSISEADIKNRPKRKFMGREPAIGEAVDDSMNMLYPMQVGNYEWVELHWNSSAQDDQVDTVYFVFAIPGICSGVDTVAVGVKTTGTGTGDASVKIVVYKRAEMGAAKTDIDSLDAFNTSGSFSHKTITGFTTNADSYDIVGAMFIITADPDDSVWISLPMITWTGN